MGLPGIIVTPLSPAVLLSAADIDIADAGGHFSSTNVEGALQELGAASPPIAGMVYFGVSTVDGTWRIRQIGSDLVFERRESGSYVEKNRLLP